MADIGELAIFMWKVAGAPPKSTGVPGRMIWAMVIPASTSAVWKTVAPTIVTGAMRPMRVTGTISTAMPASTQSMRFWQESSLYRKLPVAVIVKMDIGRAIRSARSRRKSCIISTMRGTPCSVNAPDTTGLFEFVRVMYRRQASETLASMSSLVEKAVARYGMLARPSPTRMYSTKSVESARRVTPVLWSRTLSPDDPGTKWTRSPPISACRSPARSYSQKDEGASAIACSTTSRGNRTRWPLWSSGNPWSSRRWRIPLPRISMPTSARTRFASSTIRAVRSGSRMFRLGRIKSPWAPPVWRSVRLAVRRFGLSYPAYAHGPRRWSSMGILPPVASRLMRPGSCAS